MALTPVARATWLSMQPVMFDVPLPIMTTRVVGDTADREGGKAVAERGRVLRVETVLDE